MQNQSGISPETLNQLLQLAAARLGTTPQQLTSSLQSGNLEQVVQDKSTAQKLKQIMADPGKAQAALQNTELQGMLKKFMK